MSFDIYFTSNRFVEKDKSNSRQSEKDESSGPLEDYRLKSLCKSQSKSYKQSLHDKLDRDPELNVEVPSQDIQKENTI